MSLQRILSTYHLLIKYLNEISQNMLEIHSKYVMIWKPTFDLKWALAISPIIGIRSLCQIKLDF